MQETEEDHPWQHRDNSVDEQMIREDGKQIKLSLYAIDPYRQSVKSISPRALELKIKRRDIVQHEIVFIN